MKRYEMVSKLCNDIENYYGIENRSSYIRFIDSVESSAWFINDIQRNIYNAGGREFRYNYCCCRYVENGSLFAAENEYEMLVVAENYGYCGEPDLEFYRAYLIRLFEDALRLLDSEYSACMSLIIEK